jgi:hypothetical protein
MSEDLGIGLGLAAPVVLIFWYHQWSLPTMDKGTVFLCLILAGFSIALITTGILYAIPVVWGVWTRLSDNDEYVVKLPTSSKIFGFIWKAALTVGVAFLIWDRATK